MTTLFIVSLVCGIAGATVIIAQRPGDRDTLVVADYPPPPPTVTEMFEQVPLIIHGRVEKKHVEPRGSAPPRTVIQMEVLEVIKGSVPGTPVTVFAPGGTVRAQGVETSTVPTRMAVIPVKSEVVLFLRPTTTSDGYNVAWGSAGVFQFARGSVDIPVQVRRHPEFKDKASVTESDFLSTLRELAKRR